MKKYIPLLLGLGVLATCFAGSKMRLLTALTGANIDKAADRLLIGDASVGTTGEDKRCYPIDIAQALALSTGLGTLGATQTLAPDGVYDATLAGGCTFSISPSLANGKSIVLYLTVTGSTRTVVVPSCSRNGYTGTTTTFDIPVCTCTLIFKQTSTGLTLSDSVPQLVSLTTDVSGQLPSANIVTALDSKTLNTPTVTGPTYTSVSISALDIDWATGSSFYKTLSANSTFTFSNLANGRLVTVALTNTASNYTVTWPTVSWTGGTAPTQTTGAKTDVYTFLRINGVTYGSVVQNF